MRLEIKSGDKFGMLTVIRELPALRIPSGQTNRCFECMCDCGNGTFVRIAHLVRLKVRSCGCLVGDKSGDSHTVGGLYNTWRSMRNRCRPNYFQNHLYSKKEISVCDEWNNSYLKFKTWALDNGYSPGLQIDRKDNSCGYYPDNCRFVTQLINVNNRDNTCYVNYRGSKIALSLLLRDKNIFGRYSAIYDRIKRGWNHDKAIDTPIRQGNYYK